MPSPLGSESLERVVTWACLQRGDTPVAVPSQELDGGALLLLGHCGVCGSHCIDRFTIPGSNHRCGLPRIRNERASVGEVVAMSHRQRVDVRPILRTVDEGSPPAPMSDVESGLAVVDVVNRGPLWIRVWPRQSAVVIRGGLPPEVVATESLHDFSPTFIAPQARAVFGGWVSGTRPLTDVSAMISHDETTEPAERVCVDGLLLMRDWDGTLQVTGWVYNHMDVEITADVVVALRDQSAEPIALAGVENPPVNVEAMSMERFVRTASSIPDLGPVLPAVTWQVATSTDRATREHGAETVAFGQFAAGDGSAWPFDRSAPRRNM